MSLISQPHFWWIFYSFRNLATSQSKSTLAAALKAMATVTIVGVGSPIKCKTKTTFREISPRPKKNPPACGSSSLLNLMTTQVQKTIDDTHAMRRIATVTSNLQKDEL